MKCLKVLVIVVFFAIVAQAQSSRYGAFSASITKTGNAKNSREHNTWTAGILDRNGKTQYHISREIPFDMQYPSIYVGDDGSAVVLYVFVGAIDFYNANGDLIRTLEPFGRKTAEHEQMIKCSMAGDRASFLLSTPNIENAELVMTNLQGMELWRKQLRGRQAAEVFLSSDAKYVAAGSYTINATLENFTELFGEEGQPLQTLSTVFRFADFSPDGRFVFSDRNAVTVTRANADTPGFVWKTERREHVVTGVKVVGNAVVCTVEDVQMDSGIPTYNNPMLVALNGQGKALRSARLAVTSTSPSVISIEPQRVLMKAGGVQTSIPIDQMR